MKIVWDDQKLEDYAYQSDFSYSANHMSKRSWKIRNILGGFLLGSLMAGVLFLIPNTVFSDPARMFIGVLIAGITEFVEKRSERSTKIAQASLVVTFIIYTLIYIVGLLM